jgi:hypothetical protein
MESPDNHRGKPDTLFRAHTMLRGLLPGQEAQPDHLKPPSSSINSSNASSVAFIAHAVNRLKHFSAEHASAASPEIVPGPGAQVRPRRKSKAVDEAPTDLKKLEQPGSMRWLPAHLWSRMLWLTDCWSSFRLLPLAMIHSRPPPDGASSKHEWLTW